jgi:MFS superfamily sulfate permease-like transporter
MVVMMVVMMVVVVVADQRPKRRRYKDAAVVVVVMMVMMVVLSQLHARTGVSKPSIVRLQCRDSIWDRGKQIPVARCWSSSRLN